MVVLKILTVLIAGLVSYLVFRHFQRQLQAAQTRATVRRANQPQALRRLRQDPRTGIYYPES